MFIMPSKVLYNEAKLSGDNADRNIAYLKRTNFCVYLFLWAKKTVFCKYLFFAIGKFLKISSLYKFQPHRKKNKKKTVESRDMQLIFNGKAGRSRWKSCCYWLILKKAELTNIFLDIFGGNSFLWNMNFLHP